MGHNDIDIETNQFDCEFSQALVIPLSPAKVDEQVLSLYVAEVTQAGSKSVKSALNTRGCSCAEKTNASNFGRLLRARCERPCCRTDKRDEIAPPHSITSSAMGIAG